MAGKPVTSGTAKPGGRQPGKFPQSDPLKEKEERGLVALEAEFLSLLERQKTRSATIPELFDGMTPYWSITAAHRCADKGLANRDALGKYTLTEAGLEFLKNRNRK